MYLTTLVIVRYLINSGVEQEIRSNRATPCILQRRRQQSQKEYIVIFCFELCPTLQWTSRGGSKGVHGVL